MFNTYILLAVSILITAASQLLFKKGVLKMGELNFTFSGIISLISGIFHNIYLLVGIFLFGTSFLLWLFILSKVQLNVAYPVALSIEVTLVSIGTWFLFHESLSAFQILGIVFIIAGICLIVPKG